MPQLYIHYISNKKTAHFYYSESFTYTKLCSSPKKILASTVAKRYKSKFIHCQHHTSLPFKTESPRKTQFPTVTYRQPQHPPSIRVKAQLLPTRSHHERRSGQPVIYGGHVSRSTTHTCRM